MKRYIWAHVPFAIMYGVVVAILKGGWWPISADWLLTSLLWVLGVTLGVLLVYLDRIAYIYSFPHEQLSQQASWYLKEKKYGQVLALLDSRRHEQVKLTFRSALFILAWIPLAFFAITSTSSMLGKGVVMGVMFHILSDSWRMQKLSPEKLNIRLFWQINRKVTTEEQLTFMWVVTLLFVTLSWWVR